MRILLITSDVPTPSSMPGSPRVFSLFRHVAQYHEIHLATFPSALWSIGDGCDDKYAALLANADTARIFRTITLLSNPQNISFWGRQWHRLAQAPFFITRYHSPHEFSLIRQQIGYLIQSKRPDLIFVDGLLAAQYILDFTALPRVVDAHDALSLNFRHQVTHADSPSEKLGLWLESRSIRRFELAVTRDVDAYLVNSPIDQKALQIDRLGMKVWCIPNGVDTEYFTLNSQGEDKRTLVFTGVMSYAPNRDAAHFFCTQILPQIQRVVPDVNVQFVGSAPSEDICALAGNGVMVTGTVPDIRPFVHQATVYMSPLRFGTGVKNKILAALAMGKAIVATSASCAGLDVKPEEHLLVGDSPDDFADHIVELLTNPNRRHRLGIAGRNLVVERYGWDAMAKQLQALLESLVSK